MTRRTPDQRADDLRLAREVLSRWTPRKGKTLPQLCAEVGIPHTRYAKLAHWHNGVPMTLREPLLAGERRARRTKAKSC